MIKIKFSVVILFLALNFTSLNNLQADVNSSTTQPTYQSSSTISCSSPGSFIPINTAAEFLNISSNLSASYILCSDIDFSGMTVSPIGSLAQPFSGELFGNDRQIRFLSINAPTQSNVALFASVSGTISDLRILNFSIEGYSIASTLVANLTTTGQVHRVDVSISKVVGRSIISGVVAYNQGVISDSSYRGRIKMLPYNPTSFGGTAGGLVAVNEGLIEGCRSVGSIEGFTTIGGLVGVNGYYDPAAPASLITKSWAGMRVVASSEAGGLVGGNSLSGVIERSYSIGAVSADVKAGGLVGGNLGLVQNSYSHSGVTVYSGSTQNSASAGLIGANANQVINCYSTGQVNAQFAQNLNGGLIGAQVFGFAFTNPSVLNSYWDIETSGLSQSAAGLGKTSIQMKQLSTYLPNWDITLQTDPAQSIWKLVVSPTPGYPHLTQ